MLLKPFRSLPPSAAAAAAAEWKPQRSQNVWTSLHLDYTGNSATPPPSQHAAPISTRRFSAHIGNSILII